MDFLKGLSLFGQNAPTERIQELVEIIEGQADLDAQFNVCPLSCFLLASCLVCFVQLFLTYLCFGLEFFIFCNEWPTQAFSGCHFYILGNVRNIVAPYVWRLDFDKWLATVAELRGSGELAGPPEFGMRAHTHTLSHHLELLVAFSHFGRSVEVVKF